MPDAASEISRDGLLAQLREHGVDVTPDQLVRWHKRGLLPRPSRRSLGRGRGMESCYPWIALPQAYVIRLLLDLFPRDLHSVGWCLWCFGFHVDELVRSWLVDQVERFKKQMEESYEAFDRGDPQNPISGLTKGRVPPGWGAVRRRVGQPRIETIARMLHEVLLGRFDPDRYDLKEDYELVTDAIDAQLGRASRTPDGRETVTKHAPEALQFVARDLNLEAIGDALAEAPVRLLRRVRDEAQTIFRRSAAFPGIERALLPPPFFLYWFAIRTASPTLRKYVAEGRRDEWGSVEPPLLVRVALKQRAQGKSRRKKTTRKGKKRR